ncbi:MAG: multidrug efflux MFS transporter [Negativicutes bacterium]|nr:multidrug efflux MFS transporter [Negativicutes bacterium]
MEIWKRNLFVCWLGVFATSTSLSQIMPILPLYIQELGVQSLAEIELWSGFTYGVTFICMAIVSPLWGQAADKYGRKPMLLRASLGMAVIIACMGFVQNVYQFAALRLLQGTISGFYAASITLVATQTPGDRSGWALGTLSTASLAGMLIGPLGGGIVVELIGIRNLFIGMGMLIFLAFIGSLLFVREDFTPSAQKQPGFGELWRALPHGNAMIALFITTLALQLALMSIQPIITVYVAEIARSTDYVALMSGMVFAASGFASVLAAPRLGKLADEIGPQKVMLGALLAAGLLYIPQAFVQNAWQLMGLRFLLGIATAGLLPSINSLVKKLGPDEFAGRLFGYNQAAQFAGSFVGAVLGGGVAAAFGIKYVFFFTSALLLINAAWVYKTVYAVAKGRSAAGR